MALMKRKVWCIAVSDSGCTKCCAECTKSCDKRCKNSPDVCNSQFVEEIVYKTSEEHRAAVNRSVKKHRAKKKGETHD